MHGHYEIAAFLSAGSVLPVVFLTPPSVLGAKKKGQESDVLYKAIEGKARWVP